MEKTEEKESFADFIRSNDPLNLICVLRSEDAQTAAMIICLLPAEKAALVFQGLPKEMQSEIAVEIVKGKTVLESALEMVAADIKEKIKVLAKSPRVELGGVDFAVDMLNRMYAKDERHFMAAIKDQVPDLADQVNKKLFVFEDIVLLDDRSIQKVLREVDNIELAKALKGVDNEVCDKFFRNMSKRCADMLKEDMEFMGPIKSAARDEAQARINGVVRRLEDCGEIVIARFGECEYL